jgi:hypothetical protein
VEHRQAATGTRLQCAVALVNLERLAGRPGFGYLIQTLALRIDGEEREVSSGLPRSVGEVAIGTA